MKRALVFGGTGAVGREVLKGLAEEGIKAVFTYWHNHELAKTMTMEHGHSGYLVDLRNPQDIRTLIRTLANDNCIPHTFIHCAVAFQNKSLGESSEEFWQTTMGVNCLSVFIACQELAPLMAKNGGGDIVLTGAMDRPQAFAVPVCFAASQGALPTMVMALAKELGPLIRVNQVALGLLTNGISEAFAPKLKEDFKQHSALKRLGTTREAAQAILWLALRNEWMTGKVITVNGGI